VVIDASVWVAFFVTADITHIPSYNWIDAHTQAGGLLVTPAILLTEVAAAISRRLGQVQTALSASNAIELLPVTRIVTIDTVVIKEATSIAATTRLRGMDAIYVAVAKQLALPLLTWDNEQLTRTSGLIVAVHP
jgi:predicted nucleic acid-binding protein